MVRSRVKVAWLLAALVGCSGSTEDESLVAGQGGEAGEGGTPGSGSVGGAGNDAGEAAGRPALVGSEAGTGGVSDAAPFHILTVTPADGSTKVERDPFIVEVTFSADLDTSAVDSSSLTVNGPNGAVTGNVEADADRIRFQSDTPLALLADYVIKVGVVRSADGVELAGEETFTFQTRDGVFGEPKRLWSSGYLNMARPLGTAGGHVVVQWQDELTPTSLIVTIFDPHTRAWNEPTPVEDDKVNAQSGFVCVNEVGRAFATTSSPDRWNRYEW